MEALFRSGAAADIVLAAMAIELVMLLLGGRSRGETLAVLLPGALIVLALRAALTDAAWWWIALPLTLALPVHLFDLSTRPMLSGNGRHRPSSSDILVSARTSRMRSGT